MTIPHWVQDAIFYQIFPDRFANGDHRNDPVNVRVWGSTPSVKGYMGGDIRGVIENFDYLLDLGVNALYFTPIFRASSTHRYNASDYMQIEPMLGELRDFRTLIDVAHTNKVRVVLDGVFNHCGRGFFAFSDLLEYQEDSPYRDWFHVKNWPVDAYSPGDATDFVGWWNYKALPKFNFKNSAVRKYFLDVTRYWLRLGIDGWRLDVPNEIEDDTFWAEFRQTVEQENPDAYILGEIWDFNPTWVDENHCHGLMNYPLRASILEFIKGKPLIKNSVETLEKTLTGYPHANAYSMYQLVGSHDTERIMTLAGNDPQKVKLAYTLLFGLPGAPAIYYGDEIGLEGGKDPDCRRGFEWDKAKWNIDIREHVKTLVQLRKKMAACRRGEYIHLLLNDRGVYIYARKLGAELLIVALNNSTTRRTCTVKVGELGLRDGHILKDNLGDEEFIVNGDSINLTLPAGGGMWLS
jgi:cyclomaltodextrinase / maltogenic alpha-amylase / neopullulanase